MLARSTCYPSQTQSGEGRLGAYMGGISFCGAGRLLESELVTRSISMPGANEVSRP